MKHVLYEKIRNDQEFPAPEFIHFGMRTINKEWEFPLHTHTCYEIMHITKGHLRFWINGQKFEAGANALYFVMPGQTHREVSLKSTLSFTYIKFFLCAPNGAPIALLPSEQIEKQLMHHASRPCSMVLNIIRDELAENAPGVRDATEALIKLLCIRLARMLGIIKPLGTAPSAEHLVKTAKDFIAKNIRHPLTRADIAEWCNVSPDYLGHVFKTAAGISLLNYMTELRITEAKRMIDEKNASIAKIASVLGFSDAAHFNRVFKRFAKMTPGDYRSGSVRRKSYV